MKIEQVIFKLLKDRNLKLGFCESCTGGLLSSRFTRIPGASKVFERGIITYSNISKIDELNVKKETIERHGAVSEQTALEMAKGLLVKADIDIALSVTGIAGPTGGTQAKPVGLVYIGIASKDYYLVIKYQFSGNRESVQTKTVDTAFEELRKFILTEVN